MRPEEIEIGGLYVNVNDRGDQVRVTEVAPDYDASRARVKTESRWDKNVRYFEASNFAHEYEPYRMEKR